MEEGQWTKERADLQAIAAGNGPTQLAEGTDMLSITGT